MASELLFPSVEFFSALRCCARKEGGEQVLKAPAKWHKREIAGSFVWQTSAGLLLCKGRTLPEWIWLTKVPVHTVKLAADVCIGACDSMENSGKKSEKSPRP